MTLRVAVIGLGVGEQHLIAYQKHSGCEVVAACDFSAEKRAEVAARHPGVPFTASAEEVLSDPRVDAVSIASFDDQHAAQVVAALQAGKHVFVEKPLCQSLEQLREIRATWAQHGGRVKLLSNLVLRAAPVYRWLRGQVASGAMGEIFAFDGDYLYGRLPKITQGWRARVADYSVMAGGGIHLIDLLVWITGQRPATVSAVGNRIAAAGTEFQYEDFVAATLQCPSGMVARISANFGCVHGHQHVVRVFGTRATFLLDDRGPRWQTHRDPAPPAERLELGTLPASKGELIAGFVESIQSGRQSQREEEDSDRETQADFDATSVCFACDAALRKRTPAGSVTEIEYV